MPCPRARRETASRPADATRDKKAKVIGGNHMKRKFLEDLGLEKETIDKILDENSQDIGGVKKQVEDLATANKQLSDDIKSRDTQLNDLKKMGSVEDLQNQIETLQADNARVKKEKEDALRDIKYDAAIEKALASAKHVDLVSGKIDRTKMKLAEDGVITGLDEQVKELKKTYADLFKPEKKGKEPFQGGGDPEKKPSEMTYEDFVAQLESAE